MTLNKHEAAKIYKSVKQQLREEDWQQAAVVPHLDEFKTKYMDLLSQSFELSQYEISVLENAYSIVPKEVIKRHIKELASQQLREQMTHDLVKILDIQLKKNEKEIQYDKEHMESTLSDLDTLSATLEISIKHPECRLTMPWQGTDLLILDENGSDKKEDDPSWIVVKTRHPNKLSWVVKQSFYIADHFIDYRNKYWFLGSMGEAAIEYEKLHDDELGLYRYVVEVAKDNVRQIHESFVKDKRRKVAPMRLTLFG